MPAAAGSPQLLIYDLKPKAFRARFALTPVALRGVRAAACRHGARPGREQRRWCSSPAASLREDIPQPTARPAAHVPRRASGSSGRTDLETVIEGDAQLRRGDTVIRADRLEYYQPDDLAKARGNVHINRAGNIFEGPLLELKVEAFEGFFNEPRYRFLRNDAYGEAERVDFIDDKRAIIRKATYTTCQRRPGPSWMPDWILRAASIRHRHRGRVGPGRTAPC